MDTELLEIEERLKLKDKQVKEAISILEKHGIKMLIAACGCCAGPWVRMDYQGRKIIYDPDEETFDYQDNVFIDMIYDTDETSG